MKKLGREREVHSCRRIVKNVACTALRGEQEPCVYAERESERGCVYYYGVPVSVGLSLTVAAW